MKDDAQRPVHRAWDAMISFGGIFLPEFYTGYIVSTNEIKSEEIVGKNFKILFRETYNAPIG